MNLHRRTDRQTDFVHGGYNNHQKQFLYHLRAILIGVVRQEVKRSAGSSGFMGSNSDAPQAANCIQFLTDETAGAGLPNRGVDPFNAD